MFSAREGRKSCKRAVCAVVLVAGDCGGVCRYILAAAAADTMDNEEEHVISALLFLYEE